MKITKRYAEWFVWVLTVYMALNAASLVLSGKHQLATGLLAGVVGAIIPSLINRFTRLKVSIWLHALLVVFIFLSVYLGFVRDMYQTWWPWDDIMHITSGVVVGFFGVVYVEKACRIWAPTLPVLLRVLLVTLLAAGIALLWEIFEFTFDELFGFFFQRNDLQDTMTDMISGTVFALFVASACYLTASGQKILSRWTLEHASTK